MKFIAILPLLLAGVALAAEPAAEPADIACPTVTKQLPAPFCNKKCGTEDCTFVTTVQNPCGCPASLPTATLLFPCGADCPYNGCAVDFRTRRVPCPATTTSRPTTTSKPVPTTTSVPPKPTTPTTPPSVSTGVTTLPPRTTTKPPPTTITSKPKPSTTPCPTVIQTTMPDNCPPIRCPVPNCVENQTLTLGCGCDAPKTLLFVTGCQTECPGGCMTRTSTQTNFC